MEKNFLFMHTKYCKNLCKMWNNFFLESGNNIKERGIYFSTNGCTALCSRLEVSTSRGLGVFVTKRNMIWTIHPSIFMKTTNAFSPSLETTQKIGPYHKAENGTPVFSLVITTIKSHVRFSLLSNPYAVPFGLLTQIYASKTFLLNV